MRRCRSSAQLVVTALIVAACGPKDQGAAKVDSSAAPPAPATPNSIVVHAKDFGFDAPNEIPAGMTTFRLVNDGSTFHHMQIVRLDSGKTFADLQQALKKPGPPPRWIVMVGGPAAPDPKGEANATVDLTAGTYALVCFVNVPGGVPHFAKGMIHPLTVTAATSTAPAPKADEVVTLGEYTFTLSKPLTAGTHTFEVRNGGGQPHEIEVMQLAPGKTQKDVLDWIARAVNPKTSKAPGPPPARGIGGVAAIMPGSPAYFTADLPAGDYLLVCFVPDGKDGKPHFAHGMIQAVKVS
ncbi:MAG: hypothetical protein M3068_02625 [Gemmatimonadota bacterium]|nr:hypothetical protein [Gemmatimonadota bacterium]